MDVMVPPGSQGTVYFPGTNPGAISEIGQGRATPAAAASGVSFIGVGDGRVVYRVGSGTYRFVSGTSQGCNTPHM